MTDKFTRHEEKILIKKYISLGFTKKDAIEQVKLHKGMVE